MKNNKRDFTLELRPTHEDGGGDLIGIAHDLEGKRKLLLRSDWNMDHEEFVDRLNDGNMEVVLRKSRMLSGSSKVESRTYLTRVHLCASKYRHPDLEFSKPYTQMFLDLIGKLPDSADITGYYDCNGLKPTHDVARCVWDGSDFVMDFYLNGYEWHVYSREQIVDRHAQDYALSDFAVYVAEPEFIQCSNGYYVRNSKYATGSKTFRPGVFAAWAVEAVFLEWLNREGSEAQRSVFQQHCDLMARSKLSNIFNGYSQVLHTYEGVRVAWEGKNQVYTWEMFRKLV